MLPLCFTTGTIRTRQPVGPITSQMMTAAFIRSKLVSWCFKPSQQQRIISGMSYDPTQPSPSFEVEMELDVLLWRCKVWHLPSTWSSQDQSSRVLKHQTHFHWFLPCIWQVPYSQQQSCSEGYCQLDCEPPPLKTWMFSSPLMDNRAPGEMSCTFKFTGER